MRSIMGWVGCVVVATGLVQAASAAEGRRADVVLFIADDLSWADCSIHGGRDAPMPNLDRLAGEGMTFTHAFVASPSCAPSRAALLTGLYPMRSGAMLNHARPKAELKRWPAYFKELGYETVAFGKVGHYQQTREYGFDHASHFNFHQDDCVEAAVQWLAERKSGGKPLCLVVGTNWPHVPWPEKTAFDAAKVTPWPTHVDTPETRAARARYAQALAHVDRDLGLVREAARKHLGPDTVFAFTSDHGSQWPFGKWNCYDASVRVPLVVAWPGKVTPGSKTDAMVSWVDLLPTLLEAAGGTAPKELDGRSFAAVLEGRADAHRERLFFTHSADGNAQRFMNKYPMRALRDRGWKYIRNLHPAAEHHTHIDLGTRAVDGRDYWTSWVERAKTDPAAAAVVKRYHARPAEELYDLAADPWELRNLAADPAQAERLAAMRGQLDAWMAEQGDRGMETERGLRP